MILNKFKVWVQEFCKISKYLAIVPLNPETHQSNKLQLDVSTQIRVSFIDWNLEVLKSSLQMTSVSDCLPWRLEEKIIYT